MSGYPPWEGDLAEGGPSEDSRSNVRSLGHQTAHSQYQPEHASTHPSVKRQTRNRKCLLWTWGLIFAVVIAAIIAGTLGGILSRRNSESDSSSSAAAADDWNTTSNILRSSRLAAVSWVDAYRNNVSSIVFQGASGGLVLSQWNSSSNGWNATDISTALQAAGRAIVPMNGTSIAVDAPGVPDGSKGAFLNVRFVNTANKPDYVVGPGEWSLGTTSTYPDIPTVGAASQLTSLTDTCLSGCSNSSVFLYEDMGQNLITLRNRVGDRNWNWTRFDDLSQIRVIPEPGAGLAATRFTPEYMFGDSRYYPSPIGLRLYVDVSRQLQEYTWRGGRRDWVHSDQSWPLTDPGTSGSDNYTSPRISATSWRQDEGQGWQNILVALLFGNGSIVLHSWDAGAKSWSTGFPSPTNVTALAIHDGLKAYCVQGGQVREYSIDRNNTSAWTLVGLVTTVVGGK
ncbi:hypothetical protein B0H63DRAFT_85220 [Podospora didyma]|uniref:Fucose-specific lectin n=1 Tax=Podospora didyma TaxID=330526 RepID=A0AAE0N1S5_9PEZI|nr:hypothetical protein B0H63DRAFT_85220 [Podospora didyma]